MKVLVTGSTGFVAPHLTRALLAAGHDVVALGHDARRIDAGQATVVERDLRRPDATEGLPDVDAVVHLAQSNVAFPDGARDLHAVNTGSTVALLDHARRIGASHFVYASSASVYGMGERPWREDDAPAATDFYSATKLAAERFVGAYADSFATTIMRLVAPYGPGQRNRMIPRLVESVREGRPITLNAGGRPKVNPVYVDDVVRFVAAVLPRAGGALLANVAGPDVVSIREIAEAAGRALGSDPVFDEGTARVAGDIVCDTHRMREATGDSLVSFSDGVERSIGQS